MAVERRTVVFGGRVQGVGFRMTAVRFAARAGISGTVRNLGDGGVELTGEGSAEDLDELLERLCEHFDASVRTVVKLPVLGVGGGLRIVH